MKEGRYRKEGKKEGTGRKEGRYRKEGKKKGAGRKEGRKEGRKDNERRSRGIGCRL